MVEIRPSRPEEAGAQKALWKTAFGDGDREIDWFYTCCWRPEDMLLLLEDGALASMLALLPQTVVLPGGGEAAAYYVYALATHPAARGKGCGRQLLHYADLSLRERGADCATVVPAQPSLHNFFAGVGFAPAFSTRELELPRDRVEPPTAGDGLEEAGPEEYGRIRDGRLAGMPGVGYGAPLLRYQQGLSRLNGGGLYRLTVGGAVGCAAAEYADRESVLIKELLLPPDKMARGVAQVARRLKAARYRVRTPAGWEGLPGGSSRAFGMVKWYDGEKAALWGGNAQGYMGLGFD